MRGWLGIAARSLSCALALALSGCGSDADEAPEAGTTPGEGPVDPVLYSGDVMFRAAEPLAVGGRELLLPLFLGLRAQTETRLAVKAFVDLRPLQAALPDLVPPAVEVSCGLGLDIELDRVEADGQDVRARGTVLARVYRCRDRGTETESRGMRLLAQPVDVVAVATAAVDQDCLTFRLVDLELAPKGLIGYAANLFGVTTRVRTAILDRAAAALEENPVCPDLPDEFALLDPRYTEGGPREIGDGGMGAALSGSVDASAATLISLLRVVEARRITGEEP